MSEQTVGTNNGVQLFINTDLSKIFLWQNRHDKGSFNNATYDPLVMKAGTLLGRVATTQSLKICSSAETDGSQFPVGVLSEDITIEEGDVVDVSFCVSGDVAEEQVILHNADTMNTVISSRSMRDRIASDTVGIKLVQSDEMTAFDNA